MSAISGLDSVPQTGQRLHSCEDERRISRVFSAGPRLAPHLQRRWPIRSLPMRLSALTSLILLALLPASARAQVSGDFGSLTISVRPPNAEIYVDGERWVSPDATAPLTIQLSPGPHTVQVRARGYR